MTHTVAFELLESVRSTPMALLLGRKLLVMEMSRNLPVHMSERPDSRRELNFPLVSVFSLPSGMRGCQSTGLCGNPRVSFKSKHAVSSHKMTGFFYKSMHKLFNLGLGSKRSGD